MSHGNETGDYLHEVVKFNTNAIKILFKKLRLGLNLYSESYYRQYVDLVCGMSNEEIAIEKWLGAKETFFIPRVIKPEVLNWQPNDKKIGFVGTLSHKPNIDALYQLCDIFNKEDIEIELSIVGGPEKAGLLIAKEYNFVRYKGILSDDELKKEVSTWKYFLNPVFWYSRGSSMKLAKALSWGIPTITSIAGMRGYQFKFKLLEPTPNNAFAFAQHTLKCVNNLQNAKDIRSKIIKSESFYNEKEIAAKLKEVILSI
jgi:glycosyltransferase involved in cell wall biosynthesis